MAGSRPSALDSAVMLAAATAFLYCVSTAHYGGYLGPLHLDADVLDRNFHQVLYNGFLIALAPVLYALLIYGAARFFYSHMLLPEANDWLRHSFSRRRSLLKLKRKWHGRRKASFHERQQKQHTMRALLCFAVALAFIVSMVYFESLGKKMALEILKRVDESPQQISGVITVKIDDQVRSLFYLGCGARNCAGADRSTKTIYYFPQNGHAYQHATAPSPVPGAKAHKAP